MFIINCMLQVIILDTDNRGILSGSEIYQI